MVCLIFHGFIVAISLLAPDLVAKGTLTNFTAYFIFDLFFVASCIRSSLALVSIFKQRVQNSLDLWTNLSANAFGIYLIHYVFVTWGQFALLNVFMPVILKFIVVFSGSLLLSWLIVNWARKFKWINRII